MYTENPAGNTMMLYGGRAGMRQTRALGSWARAAVAVIIFFSLGFPGNYTKVFGEWSGTVSDYGIFLLQIFLMLIYSGNNVGEIKLIDIKKIYASMYLFFTVIFVVSMMATSDAGEEVVSCVRFTVTGLFAIWICEHMKVEELLEAIYHAQIMYVIAAVSFAVLFPGLYERMSDQMNAFLGLSDTKNVTAMILVFGITMQLLLWKIRTARNYSVSGFFVGFLALQIFLMILADSKGAMLYCAIIVLMMMMLGDSVRVNVGLVSVMASIGFLIVAMTMIPMLEPVLNAIGKDATLTGRIPLWSQLLKIIRENHTLIGFGFGHFWYDDEALALLHVGFSQNSYLSKLTLGAHSDLMEMWINTGLIGLLSYYAMLIASFSRSIHISSDRYMFCMYYMMFYTFAGFTEKSWTTFGYKILIMFIAAAYACQKEGTCQEA